MMNDLPAVQYPEEAGVPGKAIQHLIEQNFLQNTGFRSILILRHGKIAATVNFAPFDDQTPSVLFSLSKTFCSAAAGFAVAEGLLSWNSKVAEVLSDSLPETVPAGIEKIELRHLLTMSSGLEESADVILGQHTDNWAKDVLSHAVIREPGTYFHYNSHSTYLVSCMVQKATGQSVRDYLMPRLFEPLGIEKPVWDTCPKGICRGGWGLRLPSSAIARFGQLLLQKGKWQGKQILPEGWVDLASTAQIDSSNGCPQPESDWAQGYGYQIWRCRFDRFRGDGMFGQYCIIDPKLDMVVACTSASQDMQSQLNLLHEMMNAVADSDEKAILTGPREKAASPAYPLPREGNRPVPCGTYFYTMNDASYSFTLRMAGDVLMLDGLLSQLLESPRPVTFALGNGKLLPNEPTEAIRDESPIQFAGAYGWDEEKLCLTVFGLNAPFTLQWAIGFSDEQAEKIKMESQCVGFPVENGQVTLTRKA